MPDASPRMRWLIATIGALALLGAAPSEDAAPASPWALPEPDACQPASGLRSDVEHRDAPTVPFQAGDAFDVSQLEVLRDFVPKSLWTYRERFFYEGMRLEIGACFADYGAPAFFRDATARFAGRAKLEPNGGITGLVAGLPFAPDAIAEDDSQAGIKWAWNHEFRYQAAGFRGKFRTSDMVGRTGRAEPFIGEIFKIQLAFRADREEKGFSVEGAKGKHWVAGGLLFEPFDAREHAWRQYRDLDHLTEPERSDDLHAYLPDYRRVRRVPAANIEGLYMPSFSVGVNKPTALPGVGAFGGGGASAGAAATTITTKRSGFEGLEIRPLLYEYSVVGLQDVLTPINIARPLYPTDPDREFGIWGLSFASDRWDLRRALVLEGRRKGTVGGTQVSRYRLHVDLQTQQPLYYESWDSRGEPIDVGMFVGRWSEGREDYPRWPDDAEREIRVIDSVGASFANIREDGGWRRESWTIVGTPPSDRAVKKQISVNNLTKRR